MTWRKVLPVVGALRSRSRCPGRMLGRSAAGESRSGGLPLVVFRLTLGGPSVGEHGAPGSPMCRAALGGQPLNARHFTPLDVAARLSVAPMMDWTDLI